MLAPVALWITATPRLTSTPTAHVDMANVIAVSTAGPNGLSDCLGVQRRHQKSSASRAETESVSQGV